MATREFIVAIELGSSKITGVAGQKNLDGSINVLAVASEESSSFIRKGAVYNINNTALAINNIVKKLSNTLGTDIKHVYVGVGGQSVHSVRNVIIKNLPDETIITQDTVHELMDSNRAMSYVDCKILDATQQEYRVGTQQVLDPVGIPTSRIEGNFLNILQRNTFFRNLDKSFELAGVTVMDMYLSPLALADSVLTDAEKRSGCLLIDLGADTTTVAVYYKNILRHLAVVPMGMSNVDRDLTSLQIEESQATQLRLKYGSAWTENDQIDDLPPIDLGDGRTAVDARRFTEIVECRVQEIIENAWYQVPEENSARLLGGIILTGGGANMRNMKKAVQQHTHIDKIRIARTLNQKVTPCRGDKLYESGLLSTVLGILAKGNTNCAGSKITTNIFENGADPRPATNIEVGTNLSEGQGKVIKPTPEEEQKMEEERIRKEQEAEEKAAAEARAAEEAAEAARKVAEEAAKKEKSFGAKLKKFFQTMITEE